MSVMRAWADQVLHAQCAPRAASDPMRERPGPNGSEGSAPRLAADCRCPGGERHEARTAVPKRMAGKGCACTTLHPDASAYDTASPRASGRGAHWVPRPVQSSPPRRSVPRPPGMTSRTAKQSEATGNRRGKLEEAFMKFARVGVAIAAAAIVVTACGGSSGADKDLKVGITLPLSGSSLASAACPPTERSWRSRSSSSTATPSRRRSSITRSTARTTRSRAPRT